MTERERTTQDHQQDLGEGAYYGGYGPGGGATEPTPPSAAELTEEPDEDDD